MAMAFEFGSLRSNRAKRALRELAVADYAVLRLLAIELDLEPGDSESMAFLTDALKETARQIEVATTHEKLSKLEGAADGR